MEKIFFLEMPDLERVVIGWEERGGIGGEELGIAMLGFEMGIRRGTADVGIWEEDVFGMVLGSVDVGIGEEDLFGMAVGSAKVGIWEEDGFVMGVGSGNWA